MATCSVERLAHCQRSYLCQAPEDQIWTYNVAGLTVGFLLHSVEGLPSELVAADDARETIHVEDLVHGSASCAFPNHIFPTASTAAWKRKGTDCKNTQGTLSALLYKTAWGRERMCSVGGSSSRTTAVAITTTSKPTQGRHHYPLDSQHGGNFTGLGWGVGRHSTRSHRKRQSRSQVSWHRSQGPDSALMWISKERAQHSRSREPCLWKPFSFLESICPVRLWGNRVQTQTWTPLTKALVVKPLHPALCHRQVKTLSLLFPDSSDC